MLSMRVVVVMEKEVPDNDAVGKCKRPAQKPSWEI
jgi:hypothetical protein